MKPLYILIIAIVALFLLISGIQGKPSFIFLFPILLVTSVAGWYLNKQIQKDHVADLQHGIQHQVEEQEAQHWLHHSFVPKTQLLLKKELKTLIAATAIGLFLFTFIWSYFVSGLLYALLYTLMALILFVLFVFYILHSDKVYKKIFKHLPHSLQKYRSNDWVHGYILLLPFSLFCFIVYTLLFSRGDLFVKILDIPLFIIFYTLAFTCLYCMKYLYGEYSRGEGK